MEQFLEKAGADALDLLRGAHFYEQYVLLWGGLRGHRYRSIEEAGTEFVNRLGARLWSPSARTIRQVNPGGGDIGVTPYPPSSESRSEFYVRVVDQVHPKMAAKFTDALLASLTEHWRQGSGDREDLVSFLKLLAERGMARDHKVFLTARGYLLSRLETLADFRAAADFCEAYPESVSGDDREALKTQFATFADDYEDYDEDPDWLRQVAGDLEMLGEKFGVKMEGQTQGLLERASEIETERAGPEPDDDDDGGRLSGDTLADDVQGMFDGLRGDLKDI